ncbi:HAD family acid phosphatase [Alteromonas flava]|uniref:HAD family acid phosphatase n=1 Tax=Alteromonas flava TaxID=2048003 RepID=UPI000C2924A0|nr:HAD family acid phosphatase [Alteromonas flava]
MLSGKRASVAAAIGAVLFITGCQSTAHSNQVSSSTEATAVSQTNDTLTFATWNVEHLAYPINQGCKPRSLAELNELQDYARTLNADVVALQEVASIAAVEQLFPSNEWQIFISQRPDSEAYSCRGSQAPSTQQKVAFAVRKGIEVLDAKSLASFGLDSPGLRYGLELELASPLGTISVLNVHMKSGCFVDNFSRADSDACKTFAQQAPLLDGWVESKEALQQPYVVLGDFNHRLSAPYNHLTRMLTTNTDDSASSLVNTTGSMIGCHPYYPAPIDHIFVGNMSVDESSLVSKAHLFKDMQPEKMLSDHCAISFVLQKPQLPLSSAVKWQTTSKEYALLTEKAYRQAQQTIKGLTSQDTPWVVVMDIDETVLDNSQYQVRLDRSGQTYTSDSWAAWVKEEAATLVPGAKSFIQTVLDEGGSLALITNRDRSLDQYTWNNLLALDLPLTTDNTCLLGRVEADKTSINHTTIINDKDLRRQQIRDGVAECYQSASSRGQNLPAARIVMQVGDNIEDLEGVTQDDADIQAILKSHADTFIMLPNPMYGSW